MFRGLTRGLQMIVDWFRFFGWSFTTQNQDAQQEALQVAGLWFREATGANLLDVIKSGQVSAVTIQVGSLLFGDPFKDSRTALAALEQKWGKH
jgi:hypothetical protein